MCGHRCVKVVTNEFTIASFKLGGFDRRLFTSSIWFESLLPLLFYRLMVAIFSLVILIYTIAMRPFIGSQQFFVLEYFTNWTYIILIGYFTFAFFNSILAVIHQRKAHEPQTSIEPQPEVRRMMKGGEDRSGPELDDDMEADSRVKVDLPWYTKAQWILYNILSGNTIIVTLVYWALIYPNRKASKEQFETNFPDVAVHGLNSVFLGLEIIFAHLPSKLLHFIHPLVYALVYLIFATIRWAFNHDKVIYKGVLDWNKPERTALVLLGMLLYFAIGQILMLLIYRLKRCLASRARCQPRNR